MNFRRFMLVLNTSVLVSPELVKADELEDLKKIIAVQQATLASLKQKVESQTSGNVKHGDITFSSNVGSWTLDPTDLQYFNWSRVGDIVTLNYRIVTSSISSTPSTISMVIPNTAIPEPITGAQFGIARIYPDSESVFENGSGDITNYSGKLKISISRTMAKAFPKSENRTFVYGGATYIAKP